MSQTIYDITQTSVPVWGYTFGKMLLIILGVLVLTAFHFKRQENQQRWFHSMLTWVFGLVWICVLISRLFEFNSVYQDHVHGRAMITTGLIRGFTPGLAQRGSTVESFTVDGVQFRYSPWDEDSVGYDKSQSEGGIFKEGMRVTIHHIRGRITRIDLHS